MTVMTLLSVILVLALWLPARSNAALITFSALFGISSGAVIGLAPVLIANISPIKELGFRMGTIMAIASVATLTSPPIAGAIVAADDGRYTFACVFSGLSFLVAVLGIALLRGRLSGWMFWVKV